LCLLCDFHASSQAMARTSAFSALAAAAMLLTLLCQICALDLSGDSCGALDGQGGDCTMRGDSSEAEEIGKMVNDNTDTSVTEVKHDEGHADVTESLGKGWAADDENADDEKKEQTCTKKTGSGCWMGSCPDSMGPAECLNSNCHCPEGYCFRQGKCKMEPLFLDTVKCPANAKTYTGGGCWAMECNDSEGPTVCKKSKCYCPDGYYAPSGKCVKCPSMEDSGLLIVRGLSAAQPDPVPTPESVDIKIDFINPGTHDIQADKLLSDGDTEYGFDVEAGKTLEVETQAGTSWSFFKKYDDMKQHIGFYSAPLGEKIKHISVHFICQGGEDTTCNDSE